MLPQPNQVGTRFDPHRADIDRKRKRGHIHDSPGSDYSNASAKQQSIQDLFSTRGKSVPGSPPEAGKLSPSKRARLVSPLAEPGAIRPPNQMYSFTNKHTNGDVVDLTASPPRNGVRKLNGVRTGINPHQGAKKLVVKNLKPQSNWNPEKYFEDTWARLDDALTKVFEGAHKSLSMEDLYRCVENLCRQGKASSVNSRLNERCVKHLKGTVLPSLKSRSSQDEVSTLQAVLSAWSTWTSQVTIIRCIFYYMDRAYLLSNSKTNLHDVCVANFRDLVFQDPDLKSRTVDGACELISRDRKEQTVDRATLRSAINMFHELAVYTSTFEPRLLAISQKYIASWSETTSQERNLPEYVGEAVKLMAKEGERCDFFALAVSTRRDLITLLEDHTIDLRVKYLIEYPPFKELLDQNASSSLEQLYSLLNRRKKGKELKPAFAKWVEDTGTAIIFDDKASEDMVVRLLSLKRRLDSIWRNCFQRDEDLGHGLRESFETFMNKTKKGESTWGTDNSKIGEMIAKYVDILLRGGSKAIPTELTVTKRDGANENDDDDDAGLDEDAEVNAQLDQVLDLFRFIHGKAVFEAFYKKDLAKRLLMGRSASADAERSMLSRLKTECGAGFTQNLEQMFKDVELGREEMAGYKDRLEEMQQKPGALDLSVNVLSAAAWPTYPDIPVVIPADVNTAIEDFERYYKSKHSGRKLSWKHSLAHCQMKAKFPKGTKEFVVSSFQAIILLLFNGLPEGERLSYEHIMDVTKLPEAEVKRTLQSLACAKLRPLSKQPVGKDINAGDTFSVNASFNHPRYRVRINQVQLKETKQENKETHERVAEDRNFECQAAIVRIMKSRKTIGHSELVAEVITATRSRGVLAVADIKRNIDRLIEKDYMEREEGNMYNYVA
ncbi:cullin-like protein 2 [Elsinoe australis]|uniref:Cullin-like protein 2 n=1 Tax=Elsinoe australis TaxID=40998 RepID=A0A4U7BCK3_9PEZI|nr:cullin-like protein 2 [Elsinoe australis]